MGIVRDEFVFYRELASIFYLHVHSIKDKNEVQIVENLIENGFLVAEKLSCNTDRSHPGFPEWLLFLLQGCEKKEDCPAINVGQSLKNYFTTFIIT